MATKYILHGGRKKGTNYQKDFLAEIIADVSSKNPTFLYIPFAKAHEQWEKLLAEKKETFAKAYPKKTFSFLLAEENPEKLLDQTHTADIIYFGGGNDEVLKKFFNKIPLPILLEHFAHKTIVGSSAGTNILAKYYYTNNRQRIEEGLGILPIKIICHFTQDKESILEELENYKEHLTSFALPEDEFVVIK